MPGLTPRSATTRMSSLQLNVTAFSPSMKSSSDCHQSRRQHTARHLNPSSLNRCPISSFPFIDNHLDHFYEAIQKAPEQLRATRYSLPAACRRAIANMLEKGPPLPRWRQQQIAKMQALTKKIQSLTAALQKLPLATVSLSVRMVDKGVQPTNVGVRSNVRACAPTRMQLLEGVSVEIQSEAVLSLLEPASWQFAAGAIWEEAVPSRA